MFFGSAINNFGIRELLDALSTLAPSPTPKLCEERTVSPDEEKFSGFVFKIHASVDPGIAMIGSASLRVCSGTFERNKTYFHVRSGKPFRTANPTAFMANGTARLATQSRGQADMRIGIHDFEYPSR
ncbi:hypothetical protein MASR2M48_21770 [Spirochaetota bacterium]